MHFKEAILKYKPQNEQEESEKRIILDYIDTFPNTILSRENEFAHLTSSAFILNKNLDKTLMVHHNIYKTWAWTGGHADGDEDLLYVAIKEAKEETGIKSIEVFKEEIASIDILPVWGHIKKGKYIGTHMHLSVAYILFADEEEELIINDAENSGVKWIPVDVLEAYCKEPQIVKIYHKLLAQAIGK